MTDYEFAELQREIQETMMYLERLQKRHVKETGKRFVVSGPMKEVWNDWSSEVQPMRRSVGC